MSSVKKRGSLVIKQEFYTQAEFFRMHDLDFMLKEKAELLERKRSKRPKNSKTLQELLDEISDRFEDL